ncbi:hypothetical protein [Acinetobacter pittii]|uniref:hypothetical protein n=1 Tax=Acinetobacter pittii TaxID=48296 RepID=UPI0008397CC7|nr:hypothetical protein [Acinetobacter pittii]MCK0868619.1 hypothetical protein [Acinetobacter pittii]MCK0920235.1 hypothetical protein [Acinetobacter pittii]OCY91445.1 hypothetical protein BFR67_05675 [Acinetobacter pittii]
MDNYKEYLDPKDGYALVKQSVNMPRNPDWIEIPEGAEIAIKFKVDNSGHGVCFYKNNGKLSFSQKNPIWEESEWTQMELLDEDFRNGNVDLTHKVLWIRKPQDPALISGADAKLAWANGKDVQISHKELDGIDWTDLHGSLMLSVFEADHMYIFRFKPATLTVNAELPKPSNVTLHNQNYSITYEFKTREERNAFADKLRGTNS